MDKDIRILRLITGEDVVALLPITDCEDVYHLVNPMRLISKRLPTGKSILYMTPWLPSELLEYNQAEVHLSDVITTMLPKLEFVQYYEAMVSDEANALNVQNALIKEEINKMTESITSIVEEEEVFTPIDKKYLH